jgi:hypothetical protein
MGDRLARNNRDRCGGCGLNEAPDKVCARAPACVSVATVPCAIDNGNQDISNLKYRDR